MYMEVYNGIWHDNLYLHIDVQAVASAADLYNARRFGVVGCDATLVFVLKTPHALTVYVDWACFDSHA